MILKDYLFDRMFKKVASWFRSGSRKASGKKGGLESLSPEELCEIDPETMDKEEIRLQLARLYKRHNHAAGSLNSELRAEADIMLDAVVHCREEYVD